MKIAIIGAGFTGLAAGFHLAQKGHKIHIFENENDIGGLSGGFKNPKWNWTLEKTYHHWFTNDNNILALAKKLNYKVIIRKPHTDILVNNKILPLDSIISLLSFPYLTLFSRIRVGFVLAYLKLSNNFRRLEDKPALSWINLWMGREATELIWQPLFSGKFNNFKDLISLSWFWARIKKRTRSLGYPEKGFKCFAEKIAEEIKNSGGIISLNNKIKSIRSTDKYCIIDTSKGLLKFDKIICTTPTSVFTRITSKLPRDYIKKVNAIPHLHALSLVLVFKKPFLKNTYWLNIAQKGFPFLVLVEHTNFISPDHYNNQHIVYIGNYLPKQHPYLKMTDKQLLKLFHKYLLKLNPSYLRNLISVYKFVSPFAQPVVGLNYSKLMPEFKTPLKNIYLANMDMVFPWDRGTNYAVELGEKIAKLLLVD